MSDGFYELARRGWENGTYAGVGGSGPWRVSWRGSSSPASRSPRR